MEAFVWLGADRIDSAGVHWPDAGEALEEGHALPGFHLLVGGVADELWRVEFEDEPALGWEGLEGTAQVDSKVGPWTPALAGALRLQMFEHARGTLARALVSVDAPEWPNAFTRDVVLDASQAGRKVATSRAPVDLLDMLEKVKPIVSELWPPQKKRGLFASKLDATRVYELLRKAMEMAIAATEEITRAVQSTDLNESINVQIAAASRLSKSDMMFGSMLRASAASNQDALETFVEEAREASRNIREIDSPEEGHTGLSGGVSFTATDGPQSFDREKPDQAGLKVPGVLKSVTNWLGDRLEIDVTEVDLSRFARASGSETKAPPKETVAEAAAEVVAEKEAAPAPAAAPRPKAKAEPVIEILAPGSIPELVQEPHDEPERPETPARSQPAAAVPAPDDAPTPKPAPKPRAVPDSKPKPATPADRTVVVVPNSPAGLETAAPGPTEPSAPERAARAASASTQPPSRAYPAPLAAHTHDSPIWGQDDLLRHVEIIHGIPVGQMEPDALQAIHDSTHGND